MSNESATEIANIVVAYALSSKKISTFITPSLVTHAKNLGINLIPLDTRKPLPSPPNFHCLIHKLYDNDWILQLQRLKSQHPEIPIIDNPDAISRLYDRDTMLEFIPLLNFECIGIPKQISVNPEDENNNEDGEFSLRFPVIAKPKAANGKPESHKLSLVFNSTGLQKVKKEEDGPLILQEFVNHGGVLYKIYVAGKHVKCVKRKSLPDLDKLDTSKAEDGVLPFSNISNLPSNSSEAGEGEEGGNVGMPPLELVNSLAVAVREYTKLNLFNIDLIRDVSREDKYLVIDINYFPGYAKCPEYESMITDFLLDVVHNCGTRVV